MRLGIPRLRRREDVNSLEEVADSKDLPLAAVNEALEYCETNRELLEQEAEHDVVTANEAGLMSQLDSIVFCYAIAKNRIIGKNEMSRAYALGILR